MLSIDLGIPWDTHLFKCQQCKLDALMPAIVYVAIYVLFFKLAPNVERTTE